MHNDRKVVPKAEAESAATAAINNGHSKSSSNKESLESLVFSERSKLAKNKFLGVKEKKTQPRHINLK